MKAGAYTLILIFPAGLPSCRIRSFDSVIVSQYLCPITGTYVLFDLRPSLPDIALTLLYPVPDQRPCLFYHLLSIRLPEKVVMHNLDIAFPEKSSAEKNRIARNFMQDWWTRSSKPSKCSVSQKKLSLKGFDRPGGSQCPGR